MHRLGIARSASNSVRPSKDKRFTYVLNDGDDTKVSNYVTEKLVMEKQLDSCGDLMPSVEILCNNQVLKSDMTVATVRAYIWKRHEDLVLHYRIMPET